jgi:hypothetical protein
VTDRDAFEEEMGFPGRIRDEDAERLLIGRVPEASRNGDLDDVAAFVTALRVAVPAQPSPETEISLVPRLGVAARSSTAAAASAQTAPIAVPRARARRPRLAALGWAACAVLLVPAAMAGLAFAGVRLPEPALETFDRLGLTLPNQSEGEGSAAAPEGGQSADEPAGSGEGAERAAGGGSNGDASGDRDRGDHRGGDRGEPGARGGAQGEANGGGSQSRQGGGPAGVLPGQGGASPGQGGTPPGQAAPPPGQGGMPPGQGGAIPGSGSGGQSAEAHGGGPPEGLRAGEANEPK